MRKVLYSLAAIAVAFTLAFVWSHTALVSPQAASTIGLANAAPHAAPIAPDIMMERLGGLPQERWDPAF